MKATSVKTIFVNHNDKNKVSQKGFNSIYFQLKRAKILQSKRVESRGSAERGYCSFVDKRVQKTVNVIDKLEKITIKDFTNGEYGKREITPEIRPLSHPVRPILDEDVDLIYFYPPPFSFATLQGSASSPKDSSFSQECSSSQKDSSSLSSLKRKRFETQFALFRLVREVPFISSFQKLQAEKQEQLSSQKKAARHSHKLQKKEEETLFSLKQQKPEMRRLAQQLADQKFELGLSLFKKVEDPSWDKNELLSFQFALNEANFKGLTVDGEDDWFEWDTEREKEEMDFNYSVDAFEYKERGRVPSFFPPLDQPVYDMRENQRQQTIRSLLYEHGLLQRGLQGGLLPSYLVQDWMLPPSPSTSEVIETDSVKPINIFRGKNDPMWKRAFPARTLHFHFFTSEGEKLDFKSLLHLQLRHLQQQQPQHQSQQQQQPQQQEPSAFSELENTDSDSPVNATTTSPASNADASQTEEKFTQQENLVLEENQLQQLEGEIKGFQSAKLFEEELKGKEEKFEGNLGDEGKNLSQQTDEKASNTKKEEKASLDPEEFFRKIEIIKLSEEHADLEEEFKEWSETEDGKEALRLLKNDPIGNPIFLERHMPSHFPYDIVKLKENSKEKGGFLSFKELIDKLLYLITGEQEDGVVDPDPYKQERQKKKEREKQLSWKGKQDLFKYPIEFRTYDFIQPDAGVLKNYYTWKRRKVVMKLWLPSLQLPHLVNQRLIKICGPRYKGNGIIRLSGDIYPTQHQNRLYLLGLFRKLMNEAFLAHPQYIPSFPNASASPQDPSHPLHPLFLYKENHKKKFLHQLRITAKHRDAVIFRIRNLPKPAVYFNQTLHLLSLLHFKHLLLNA